MGGEVDILGLPMPAVWEARLINGLTERNVLAELLGPLEPEEDTGGTMFWLGVEGEPPATSSPDCQDKKA